MGVRVVPVYATLALGYLEGKNCIKYKKYNEGRSVLFNDALNTFIYGYMASGIW